MDSLKRDRLVGIILMAIALSWSVIVYQTIPASQAAGMIGPRAFPLFLGLILTALSAAIVLRTFVGGQDEEEHAPGDTGEETRSSADGREAWLAGGVFLLIILYGFLMEKVGFLLSTPLVIVAALAGVLGLRRPLLIASLAIGVTLGCWVIFGKMLGVYLPHGSWVSLT